MQDRHQNRLKYFQEQVYTTAKYVIPYIQAVMNVRPETRVLEIGCGEGGNLKPFLDMGCTVVGIDILPNKIDNAKTYYQDHPLLHNLQLIAQDIYKVDAGEHFVFDLIIMRDTIEHIPDQDRFLEHLKKFLKADGKIFFAFPPWRMPFGGHQQICKNKWLSVLPYFHILPKFLYKGILQAFGESATTIQDLMDIKDTRLSISTFKNLLAKRKYRIDTLTYYVFNPNYEIKFGLKPLVLPGLLAIPFLMDFYTTAVYCMVGKNE